MKFVVSQIKAAAFWEIVNLKVLANMAQFYLFNSEIKKKKTVFMTQEDLNQKLRKPVLNPTKYFSKLSALTIALFIEVQICQLIAVALLIYLAIKFVLCMLVIDKYMDFK